MSNSLTKRFIYLMRFNKVSRVTLKMIVFSINFSFSIIRRVTILKRSNLKSDLIINLTNEKKTIIENKNNVIIHNDDDLKIYFENVRRTFLEYFYKLF